MRARKRTLLINAPETNAIVESVTVPSGQDYIFSATLGSDMFAILDVINTTDNYKALPEPQGMIGRSMLCTVGGKPASGPVTHYIRDGNKVWVRNTPTTDTTLQFRIMRVMPDLSDTDINDTPIVPSTYHMAIVYAAAESYYMFHPSTDMVNEVPVILSEKYKAAKMERISTQREAVMEEDRSRFEAYRVSGYRLGARTAWR